jgi:hypothetical protein
MVSNVNRATQRPHGTERDDLLEEEALRLARRLMKIKLLVFETESS